MTAPTRRDAQANRQRLLTAARELFAEKGLDVTLDDVAARAKVGVGTAYRNFANKDVLIDDLLIERMDELVAVAEESLLVPDAWTGLRSFLERSLEMQLADRGLKQVLFSRDRGHVRVDRAKACLAPTVAQLVERAQAAGQLRADVGPSDIPLINIMVSTVIDFARDLDSSVHLRYLEILLNGLRSPEPLPAGPMPMPEFERAMRRWRGR